MLTPSVLHTIGKKLKSYALEMACKNWNEVEFLPALVVVDSLCCVAKVALAAAALGCICGMRNMMDPMEGGVSK